MGRIEKGGQGCSYQAVSSRAMNDRPSNLLSGSLAQSGGPLTSGAVSVGGHHCSDDTRIEMAFWSKESLMESSPVLGLPLNWRLLTFCPPLPPPPGRPRGYGPWGEGLDQAPGSLALCDALGEMASLRRLDDKTLLMAPIKKCECNFLLLVIPAVFGILFNRSTGHS